jgi:ribonuclease VapC
MIVDTSALLAILFGESDAEIYARAIAEAEVCRISAAIFVEVSVVVEAQTGDPGSRQWDAFFRRAGIVIESVTEDQAHVARQAYSDFGKGRKRAALNFGDCFSYALAKVLSEPLLYKGGDFRKTDILSAI